jgi:hypothetical protein
MIFRILMYLLSGVFLATYNSDLPSEPFAMSPMNYYVSRWLSSQLQYSDTVRAVVVELLVWSKTGGRPHCDRPGLVHCKDEVSMIRIQD